MKIVVPIWLHYLYYHSKSKMSNNNSLIPELSLLSNTEIQYQWLNGHNNNFINIFSLMNLDFSMQLFREYKEFKTPMIH